MSRVKGSGRRAKEKKKGRDEKHSGLFVWSPSSVD